MKIIEIESKKPKEIIDITELVNQNLDSAGGLCHLFALHTTAALTTADLDPGTDLDMLDAFGALIPGLKFRHPHDPGHVPDHILSSLIGTSILLPFEKGKLILGEWQRVVFAEFSGPRRRKIAMTFIRQQ